MITEKKWGIQFIYEFQNLEKNIDNGSTVEMEVNKIKIYKIRKLYRKEEHSLTVSDLIYYFMADKYYELTGVPNVINYQPRNAWIKILRSSCKDWSDESVNCLISIMSKAFCFNKKSRAKSFSDITCLAEYQQISNILIDDL